MNHAGDPVDRLVSMADVMIWVLDPQKYADAAVHRRFLVPMAGHSDVLAVVLNQADLLDPAQVDDCVADLRRLLDSENLPDVPILVTSAVSRRQAWTSCARCWPRASPPGGRLPSGSRPTWTAVVAKFVPFAGRRWTRRSGVVSAGPARRGLPDRFDRAAAGVDRGRRRAAQRQGAARRRLRRLAGGLARPAPGRAQSAAQGQARHALERPALGHRGPGGRSAGRDRQRADRARQRAGRAAA